MIKPANVAYRHNVPLPFGFTTLPAAIVVRRNSENNNPEFFGVEVPELGPTADRNTIRNALTDWARAWLSLDSNLQEVRRATGW